MSWPPSGRVAACTGRVARCSVHRVVAPWSRYKVCIATQLPTARTARCVATPSLPPVTIQTIVSRHTPTARPRAHTLLLASRAAGNVAGPPGRIVGPCRSVAASPYVPARSCCAWPCAPRPCLVSQYSLLYRDSTLENGQ